MMSVPGKRVPETEPEGGISSRGRWLECAGIAACLLLLTGGPVPGVNEAHYLVRARHYWDPAWCGGDFFLRSPDAHHVFYWAIGWLTQWLSLPLVAWIGRIGAAVMLAHSLARLCWTLQCRPGIALLFATLYVTLQKWTPMAGEWVVGGVEAKVFAYGFVFYALGDMVQGRWRRVWLWTGAAAGVHVLVGGWATLAALGAWLASRDRLPLRQMWPWLAAGGILSLLGVLPGVALGRGVDPDVAGKANMIYVYERLSHHLLVSRFDVALVVRHMAAVLVGGILVLGLRAWRNEPVRRLCLFVGAAVLVALVGTVIDLLLPRGELEAGLLRFYWFRLSDAMVPLLVSLLLVQLASQFSRHSARMAQVVLGCCLLVVLVNALGTLGQRILDPRPDADRMTLPGNNGTPERRNQVYWEWRNACDWIRQNTDPDAVFLTPREQQTFKWYAERAEVVNWKNIPQGAGEVVEWWRRAELVTGHKHGFHSFDVDELKKAMRCHQAEYLVIAHGSPFRSMPLERVYPAEGKHSLFEVYRLEP
jgi:hypothetical protein